MLGEEKAPPVAMPVEEPWKQFLDPIDKTPPKKQLTIISTQQEKDDNEPVHLDELIPLALNKFRWILKNTPLVPDREDYIANAKLVLATAQAVTTAQIKVDENRLRRRKQEDILTVLQALRDEEKKQALFEAALEE